MSQKNVLIIVVIVLLLLAGVLMAWYFLQDQEDDVTNTNQTVTNSTNNDNLNTTKEIPELNEVFILDGFFNPSVVSVKVGDTVTWVNKDEIDRQVASDPYPNNSDLPGLVSDVLTTGDEYSYTFEEAGTWFYHDNLNPISKGTIIVE